MLNRFWDNCLFWGTGSEGAPLGLLIIKVYSIITYFILYRTGMGNGWLWNLPISVVSQPKNPKRASMGTVRRPQRPEEKW